MKILKYKTVKYLKYRIKARYRERSLILMNTVVTAMIGEKGLNIQMPNEYVDDIKSVGTVLRV